MPMLIIAAALYSEAKPFIDFYDLKKDLSFSSFQVFRKEGTALYITGSGPMEAAIVTSHFLALQSPSASDMLINVGICGSRRHDLTLGTAVLCNKLIEQESGRTFYPDVLYSHPFQEGSIITSFSRQEMPGPSEELCLLSDKDAFSFADMEAAAIYQAGSYFFQPHQMLFVKIVSDYLTANDPEFDKNIPVTTLMGGKVEIIAEWITEIMNNTSKKTNDFTREETEYISQLSQFLKLSVTMEHELRQYLRYYKLVNGDFLSYTRSLAGNMPLPVKSKTEGKKYLDYFKKNLL